MPPSTQTAALLSPSTNAKRAMMPHILPGAAHLRHSNPTKRTSTASSPVCCPLLFLVTGNTRSHSHWHRRHYHAPLHNKPTVTSLTSYGHRPMLMHPSTKPRVWSVPPPPQPLLAGTAQESTLYYATMTPSPTGCDGTTQHLVVTGDLYIDPATSIPQRTHRQCDTLTPCLLARTRTTAPVHSLSSYTRLLRKFTEDGSLWTCKYVDPPRYLHNTNSQPLTPAGGYTRSHRLRNPLPRTSPLVHVATAPTTSYITATIHNTTTTTNNNNNNNNNNT